MNNPNCYRGGFTRAAFVVAPARTGIPISRSATWPRCCISRFRYLVAHPVMDEAMKNQPHIEIDSIIWATLY